MRVPEPYEPAEYPPFAVAVDLVVLTVRNDNLCLLVIERGAAPFEGHMALPGGFVGVDEDLLAAARRELHEETGVSVADVHLEQVATFGRPNRDPRMRVVSVAYLALAANLPEPRAGTDAAAAHWMPLPSSGGDAWAFDHAEIVDVALERARAKLEYTTLATEFCAPEFTIGELRRVYELVWGTKIDPRNFHRKVMKTRGFVEETGVSTSRGRGRPAQLYRAGQATSLHPPLVRS